jgi:hypothetical protein
VEQARQDAYRQEETRAARHPVRVIKRNAAARVARDCLLERVTVPIGGLSGSLVTRRWREPDSNCQSPVTMNSAEQRPALQLASQSAAIPEIFVQPSGK